MSTNSSSNLGSNSNSNSNSNLPPNTNPPGCTGFAWNPKYGYGPANIINSVVVSHQKGIQCLLGMDSLGGGIGLNIGGVESLCAGVEKKIGNCSIIKLIINPTYQTGCIQLVYLGSNANVKYCKQANETIQLNQEQYSRIVSSVNIDNNKYSRTNFVFWIVRHGKGVHNKSMQATGRLDAPLIPQGIQDAITAGQELNRLIDSGTISYVFVSDLLRTQQTAFHLLNQITQDKPEEFIVLPCNYEIGGKKDCSSSGIALNSMFQLENNPDIFYGLTACNGITPIDRMRLNWTYYVAFYQNAFAKIGAQPQSCNSRKTFKQMCNKRKPFRGIEPEGCNPCMGTNMIDQALKIIMQSSNPSPTTVHVAHFAPDSPSGVSSSNSNSTSTGNTAPKSNISGSSASSGGPSTIFPSGSAERLRGLIEQTNKQQPPLNPQGPRMNNQSNNEAEIPNSNNSQPKDGDVIQVPSATGNGSMVDMVWSNGEWIPESIPGNDLHAALAVQAGAPYNPKTDTQPTSKKPWYKFWGGKKSKYHKKHANRKTKKNKNKKTIKHMKKHKKHNKKTRHHKKK